MVRIAVLPEVRYHVENTNEKVMEEFSLNFIEIILYEKFVFCVRQKIHVSGILRFMFFGLNIYDDPFL